MIPRLSLKRFVLMWKKSLYQCVVLMTRLVIPQRLRHAKNLFLTTGPHITMATEDLTTREKDRRHGGGNPFLIVIAVHLGHAAQISRSATCPDFPSQKTPRRRDSYRRTVCL